MHSCSRPNRRQISYHKKNGWFLYLSSKPNAEAYKLTQIYNHKLINITRKYDTADYCNLIKYYSVYNNLHICNSSNTTPINNNFNNATYDDDMTDQEEQIRQMTRSKIKTTKIRTDARTKQKPEPNQKSEPVTTQSDTATDSDPADTEIDPEANTKKLRLII